jgi:hypothetical protein
LRFKLNHFYQENDSEIKQTHAYLKDKRNIDSIPIC